MPVDAVALVTKGLQVTGVLGGIPFLKRAARLIEEKIVHPGLLIDRVLPWSDYGSALELMMNRTATRPKLILDFTGLGERKVAASMS